MTKFCPICDKGNRLGGKRNLLRGKYNPTKTIVKKPNLQWARFSDGQRMKICTNCLKRGLHLTTTIK